MAAAINYLQSVGAGLRFTTVGNLPSNALMGAVLNSDQTPQIIGGFATIRVNPDLIRNPAHWGRELETVMLHELLHFNPNYQGASINRWTRNGSRAFDQARYNDWHNAIFFARARQIRGVLRRSVNPVTPAPQIQVGTLSTPQLAGTASFNELEGADTPVTFQASGHSDFLWGGTADDRYVFGATSTEYLIHDEGGANVLAIEGPYSLANIRVGRLGRYWVIGVVDDPASQETAVDAVRNIAFAALSNDEPCVQVLEVGGANYALPSLQPNGRPSLMALSTYRVMDTAFPGGPVATVEATDLDGDPLTYTVKQVISGIGSASQWWFDGPVLSTTYQHNGLSGLTRLLISVSDGAVAEDQTIIITWAGGRG